MTGDYFPRGRGGPGGFQTPRSHRATVLGITPSRSHTCATTHHLFVCHGQQDLLLVKETRGTSSTPSARFVGEQGHPARARHANCVQRSGPLGTGHSVEDDATIPEFRAPDPTESLETPGVDSDAPAERGTRGRRWPYIASAGAAITVGVIVGATVASG